VHPSGEAKRDHPRARRGEASARPRARVGDCVMTALRSAGVRLHAALRARPTPLLKLTVLHCSLRASSRSCASPPPLAALRIESPRPGALRIETSRPGALCIENLRPGAQRIEKPRPGARRGSRGAEPSSASERRGEARSPPSAEGRKPHTAHPSAEGRSDLAVRVGVDAPQAQHDAAEGASGVEGDDGGVGDEVEIHPIGQAEEQDVARVVHHEASKLL